MKSDLYECLTNLHPSLYSSKFFHLLHSTTDDIVVESTVVPNVMERYISREDDCYENAEIITKGVRVNLDLMNEDGFDES